MPHATSSPAGIRIAIDRGGTFTDCLAIVPGQPDILIKLLSNDPANYDDAPAEGIRRILEIATCKSAPRGASIDTGAIESIKMGTTVATNALLERASTPCAFAVTRGFKDLLRIGDQTRPKLFDLNIRRPGTLFDDVVEIDERVTLHDSTEVASTADIDGCSLREGRGGERVRVMKSLDRESTRKSLQAIYDRGARTLAVTLLRSYTFPDHEIELGGIATEIGFSQVSLSCQIFPTIRAIGRGYSATADAYLAPITRAYVDGFRKSFVGDLESETGARCELMQSDGGLVPWQRFSGLKAILSGPAGGVVGFSRTCYDEKRSTPVIGFDMGGTSTDVSRYAGSLEHTFESVTAGVTIQSPQLDVETVAAGGGSILAYRNGLFMVDPESAGAHPGPVAYRKGGPLTVTDANLVLGRLQPQHFPKIFGPNEDQPLDLEGAQAAFERLLRSVNDDLSKNGAPTKSVEELALGFVQVANETMCRPIRSLTEAKGYRTGDHELAVFGAPAASMLVSEQAIATNLGIKRVLIHRYSSILSAYGMALADLVHDIQKPRSASLATSQAELHSELRTLEWIAMEKMRAEGVAESSVKFERFLNLRYVGSDTTFMIQEPDSASWAEAFTKEHRRQFSFTMEGRDILVESVRVRAVAEPVSVEPAFDLEAEMQQRSSLTISPDKTSELVRMFFESGWTDAPLHLLADLEQGSVIDGPAIILDQTQTIVVTPGSRAIILKRHVVLELVQTSTSMSLDDQSDATVDPAQLSVMGHRFMSIAEQMGHTLQKTSVSVNIKERLDFSCALFSPHGRLVANAPHVPVHLGSMEQAVMYQHERLKDDLKPGDVIFSNHPISGGTHLPDITCITPVFDSSGERILFYTASRGHHQEIGGILPGSMPAGSVELHEEGATIVSEYLVRDGRFDEALVRERMLDDPARYPHCSGTRKLADNINDLKAQVSANNRGAALLAELIGECGLNTVHFYMRAITDNAEACVRAFLLRTYHTNRGRPLSALDFMDDGTPIALTITIDPEHAGAHLDWTGTGEEGYHSFNAPQAITRSATLYVLRCLIDQDIPLNEGCLRPLTFTIPAGTILNPSPTAAVCAGNPITSQRVTDVLIKAFGAAAASQGDCNVVSFGADGTIDQPDSGWGFGETIGGGSGAGPGWHGTSGVHINMTNTRITDPEILEKRYPLVLREFSIRAGSGGEGKWKGGDGVRRIYQVDANMSCSIVSERRVTQPYGHMGGGAAERGRNFVVKGGEGGRWCRVGGRKDVTLKKGDWFVVDTPGGGGWGVPEEGKAEENVGTSNGLERRYASRFQIAQEASN